MNVISSNILFNTKNRNLLSNICACVQYICQLHRESPTEAGGQTYSIMHQQFMLQHALNMPIITFRISCLEPLVLHFIISCIQ